MEVMITMPLEKVVQSISMRYTQLTTNCIKGTLLWPAKRTEPELLTITKDRPATPLPHRRSS